MRYLFLLLFLTTSSYAYQVSNLTTVQLGDLPAGYSQTYTGTQTFGAYTTYDSSFAGFSPSYVITDSHMSTYYPTGFYLSSFATGFFTMAIFLWTGVIVRLLRMLGKQGGDLS